MGLPSPSSFLGRRFIPRPLLESPASTSAASPDQAGPQPPTDLIILVAEPTVVVILVAFNVNPQMYHEHNGYIISEQGKPPDFIMEVASPSTAENDTGVKRDEYAALGIPEYWRFDSTGADYGERLVGEVLDGDSYRSVDVSEIAPDVLQGYSLVLNLLIRWDQGQLEWLDPHTETPIPSWDDAEARVRELEEENRRLRQQLANDNDQ